MATLLACLLLGGVWLGSLTAVAGALWLTMRPKRWARIVGSTGLIVLVLAVPHFAATGRWLA